MIIREVAERSLTDYAIEQLRNGFTALSEIVAREIDISRGRFFLIMPSNLDTSRIENWARDPGRVRQEQADEILANVMASYLRAPGKRVLIQDFERKSSEPHFSDDELRTFYGVRPYWELQRQDIEVFKLMECINDASYWPWIGYFCKARKDRSKFITERDLEDAAAHLIGMAIQALHNSYLFWWRADLEKFPASVD